MIDPAEVLGLTPSEATDPATVKRAYARLLKQHRPDRDPEGFRRIHEAYLALTDGAPPPRAAEKISLPTVVEPAAESLVEPPPVDAAEAAQREREALRQGRGDLGRWRHFVLTTAEAQPEVMDHLVDPDLVLRDALSGHDAIASTILRFWSDQGRRDELYEVAEGWAARVGDRPPGFAPQLALFLARCVIWSHPTLAEELADLAFRQDRAAVDPDLEAARQAARDLERLPEEQRRAFRTFLQGDTEHDVAMQRQVRSYVYSADPGPLRQVLQRHLGEAVAKQRAAEDFVIPGERSAYGAWGTAGLDIEGGTSFGRHALAMAGILVVMIVLGILFGAARRGTERPRPAPLAAPAPAPTRTSVPLQERPVLMGSMLAKMIEKDVAAGKELVSRIGETMNAHAQLSTNPDFISSLYRSLLRESTTLSAAQRHATIRHCLTEQPTAGPGILRAIAQGAGATRAKEIADALADHPEAPPPVTR